MKKKAHAFLCALHVGSKGPLHLSVPWAFENTDDNDREYLNHTFHEFLSSKGIDHQISCAYTLMQNEVAERKNHHLLDVPLYSLIYGGCYSHCASSN